MLYDISDDCTHNSQKSLHTKITLLKELKSTMKKILTMK